MAYDQVQSWLKSAAPVLEFAHTFAETAALVLAGVWAYYKFFRGRTFRPRLELTVSGTIRQTGTSAELLALAQIKNVGLSKLVVSQAGTALVILRSLPITEETGPLVPWEQVSVLPVFEKHAWIEPAETITDQQLLQLSFAESTAIKLDLRVVASKIEWNHVSIVPTDCNNTFRTEVSQFFRGENSMDRLREQKKEDPDITKKIEDSKFQRQKQEDSKETKRIEHDKLRPKK
jgi:hypothetical protein